MVVVLKWQIGMVVVLDGVDIDGGNGVDGEWC